MPSNRCCVFGCLTTGVTIHRFPSPKKFPERFRLWVDLAKDSLANLPDDYIYNCKRVCNRHFADDVHNRCNRLNVLAIPTLHLPGQTQSQETRANHAQTSGATEACDDNDDGDDDDHSVEHNIRLGIKLDAGGKGANSGLFSWNKNSDVVPETGEESDVLCEVIDDTDNLICEKILSEQKKDGKLKDAKIKIAPEKSEHVGFQCNSCQSFIAGYRYSCVQCDDYDLCGRCEGKGVHALHYMLRVPGPRPYEEVQSMLQLIRRQLFQSDILLKSSDADIMTPFSEESIKLELKDDVEEVDPFESTTGSASVSPLFGRTGELEDTGQENVNDMDTESAIELPPDNVPSLIKSRHSRRTYIPRKRKVQDSDESSRESTTDKPPEIMPLLNLTKPVEYTLSDEQADLLHLNETQDIEYLDEDEIDLPSASIATKPNRSKQSKRILHERNIQDSDDSDKESSLDIQSKNALTKNTFFDEQTIIPKNKTQNTDESDEECRIVSPSPNVASKLTYSNRLVKIPFNRKLQDSNKESTKDLRNLRMRTRKYFPPKRKTQQQITENSVISVQCNDIKNKLQCSDIKNSEVVLSRLPLELVNQQKLIENDVASINDALNIELGIDKMPDVATDNVKGNEQGRSMLVTPEHLGLSEIDIRKMFNLSAQDRKRIFIRIEKTNAPSQPQQAHK